MSPESNSADNSAKGLAANFDSLTIAERRELARQIGQLAAAAAESGDLERLADQIAALLAPQRRALLVEIWNQTEPIGEAEAMELALEAQRAARQQ